ncbi:M20/M25/M40 family metallo-hydrolase [Steroidobacter sp.]|uniref:M20/M25/M40 family metallo-hydrolase n=1 Tax=Steroidobacter sp. TaxID=1978227 RepID=UPI001A5C47E5|nr:M20/M25/M40 family metallo-hydrolase [Steroidobacter sp.]MBL8269227.1 M20/M25/M40 family metallo-hydrolase [Steroidobacter sp.]
MKRLVCCLLVWLGFVGVAPADPVTPQQLQAALEGAIAKGAPGVSAAIATRDGVIWTGAAGYADIKAKTPMTTANLMGVGSITKVFVTTVIMQLSQEGQLDLNRTAVDYLGSDVTRGIANTDRATLAQLLGHTGGVISWEDDPRWIREGRGSKLKPSHIWGKTEPLEYIRGPEHKALNEPGEKHNYSNTNYTLLGLIIEKVTGNTAEAEIRKRVLEPLGLHDTFLEGFESFDVGRLPHRYHWGTETFEKSAGIAKGFKRVRPDLIDATGSNLSVEWTAGGMVSTPSDIARLALAIRDARIVSPASLKFLTEWTPINKNSEVGHGLFRTTTDAGVGIGHTGSVLGFTGGFYWAEKGDAVVAVTMNVGTMHAGKSPMSAARLASSAEFGALAVRFAEQYANPPIANNFDAAYKSLLANERVTKALAGIKSSDEATLREQIEIAQIPAPSFKEQVRGRDFQARLEKLGLKTSVDSEGNVIATRKGSGQGKTLVLSAHLDTVFPEGTDVTVRKEGERYYGRGLADDTRGLVVVLSVLRAMQQADIRTVGDVMFVGTVGEEGLGNLRGVKALLKQNSGIDGFITVEPSVGGRERIGVGATGSRRWRVTFKGPGGHSSGNFGVASAIHAMGRAITHISDLQPPLQPRTTFTVGVVSGGTSVNTIASQAIMEVDIRSDSAEALTAFEKQVLAAVELGAQEENLRWHSQEISVDKQLAGDRPAGTTGADSSLVSAARQSYQAIERPGAQLTTVSTDTNAAIALGVPAIMLSGGGVAGDLHSPGEWFEPREAWLGPQVALLTVLGLVGVQGVTEPLLEERR